MIGKIKDKIAEAVEYPYFTKRKAPECLNRKYGDANENEDCTDEFNVLEIAESLQSVMLCKNKIHRKAADDFCHRR